MAQTPNPTVTWLVFSARPASTLAPSRGPPRITKALPPLGQFPGLEAPFQEPGTKGSQILYYTTWP